MSTAFILTPASRRSGSDRTVTILFVLGMVSLPLQSLQIGIAQPAHIWLIGAAMIMALRRTIAVTRVELCTFILFAITTILLTELQPYERVKVGQQLLKFLVIYPGFYLLGRAFGELYWKQPLPYGNVHLLGLLILQYLIQALAIPVLYQQLDFGGEALHGSFKERNWLAIYIFLASYLLILRTESNRQYFYFFLINGITAVLSGSKMSLISCGIAFCLKAKTSVHIKTTVLITCALFYWLIFSNDLSQELIEIRLEEERGLAFQVSLALISSHTLGYGLGFVEAYFSHIAILVRGLGEGTNSVFAAPLDLAIISGVVGLALWVIFFLGIGIGAVSYLAPIAVWSLLDPLHQSETVYLFMGMLVSWAHLNRVQHSDDLIAMPRVLPIRQQRRRYG